MAALEPEFSTAVLQGPALRKSSFGGARRSSMSSAPAAAAAAADALVQPGWSLTPSERAGVLLHWATLGPGRDDRLAAYASTLPAADDLAVGLLLTDAEAAELQDPDLAAKVSAARARADAVAEQVRDVLGADPVNLDVANLSLSLARACSRTFGALDGALGLICPVADMMNHRFGPQCNFRLAASGDAFEFYSVGEAAAGEELHISYGEQLTNAELMLTYGFCVPGNPNETLGVSIDAAAALRAKGDRGGEEDPKERRQLAAIADALRLETAAEATAYLAAARRAVANSAAVHSGGGEEGGSPALDAAEAADACESTQRVRDVGGGGRRDVARGRGECESGSRRAVSPREKEAPHGVDDSAAIRVRRGGWKTTTKEARRGGWKTVTKEARRALVRDARRGSFATPRDRMTHDDVVVYRPSAR